jgi:hypothetical protein
MRPPVYFPSAMAQNISLDQRADRDAFADVADRSELTLLAGSPFVVAWEEAKGNLRHRIGRGRDQSLSVLPSASSRAWFQFIARPSW